MTLRSHRLLKQSALAAAAACALLWLAGYLFPASLIIRNTGTHTEVRLRINNSFTCTKGPYSDQFPLPPSNTAVGAITVCNSDAAVLVHHRFNAGPFDATRLPLPSFALPFWAPILLVSALAYALHRRGPGPGLCRRCSYNLSGLPPGSPCPECGHTERLKAQSSKPQI